eukprot:CAMPEP_0115532416 /NCGR_PEP_ID=MMETSP0271-20121206/85567_1 /TAXON_ID=71861 /ORGANISM="Scrippsiella trochoidea, Strain CCMP3099" /LENGTH=49 /DNA_ID=CAMNT_0002964711 /DNA_START=197 /DNA_END=346 /DNA_ORIENTATION=-
MRSPHICWRSGYLNQPPVHIPEQIFHMVDLLLQLVDMLFLYLLSDKVEG